jgi:hypothetical protein
MADPNAPNSASDLPRTHSIITRTGAGQFPNAI